MMIEELETAARDLNLLLLQKQPSPDLMLPLDYDKLVSATLDVIHQDETDVDEEYLCAGLTIKSEVGKVLILSPGSDAFQMVFGLAPNQYALIGGVARLLDQEERFLSYRAFTVDRTNEASVDGFKNVNFGKGRLHAPHFTGPLKFNEKLALPQSLLTSDHNMVYVSYSFLFYENIGPLGDLNDTRSLNSVPEAFSMDGLEDLLVTMPFDESLIQQAVSLVRIIQFRTVIDPNYNFETVALNNIKVELAALEREKTNMMEWVERGEETREEVGTKWVEWEREWIEWKEMEKKEKKKEILMEACKLVQLNIDGHEGDIFPSLKILLKLEKGIRNDYCFCIKNPFDLQWEVEESANDNSLGEPIVSRLVQASRTRRPCLLAMPCVGDISKGCPFRLIQPIYE